MGGFPQAARRCRFGECGFKVELSDKAKDFLAQKGFDPQYGARPLHRAIQKYLEDQVAEEILKGDVKEGDIIKADYPGKGEELIISITKSKKKTEGQTSKTTKATKGSKESEGKQEKQE